MQDHYEIAKAAAVSLRDSEAFDFRWPDTPFGDRGFSALLPRSQTEFYSVKCFANSAHRCVYLSLIFPLECDFAVLDYVKGYLDCVNRSHSAESVYLIGSWERVEARRGISYDGAALTVSDLEETLRDMVAEAERYLPVIEAVALDNPVPADAGEPSRLFHEVYRLSDEFAAIEHPQEKAPLPR